MKKFLLLFVLLCCLGVHSVQAGNPDRQGEAGAYELLMNPWARSAGLHTMTTANVKGVEALRLNVAGLSRINKTEVNIGHARYLEGADIRLNAFGVAQRVGAAGAFGFSVMSVDFGDIPETTVAQPEGTGTTFSPRFFNIGVGYSHTFSNKISVGATFRVVSEGIADVAAMAFAVDAGVQYVAGEEENFKFGISLRNIGSRMTYRGEGLSVQAPTSNNANYELTFTQRGASFELPSLLNIGLAYDFLLPKHRLTIVGNFTANSFSQDQIGGGLEYALNEMFMLRAAYKYEFGSGNEVEAPIYSGLSAGASVLVPLSKEKKDTQLEIDYAYRSTKIWNGTHNIGVKISI